LALTGAFFSFLAAAACLKSPLTQKDRVPRLTYKAADGEELDDNDPAKKLQREREQEAEKRYKEMFGDEDGDDEFNKGPSKLPKKLSLVMEGENESSSHHMQNKMAPTSRQSSYDDDVEEFHDEDDDDSHGGKTHAKSSNKSRDLLDNGERYDKAPNKGNPFGDNDHDDHDDDDDDYDDKMQSLADSEMV
jgi:hypothetical protein